MTVAGSMRRVALFLVTLAAATVLPAGPGLAAVSISTSLTVPAGVSVGQANLAGSFTVTNRNTAPNNTESNTLTSIRLALSCGTTPTSGNPCPTPDPGNEDLEHWYPPPRR